MKRQLLCAIFGMPLLATSIGAIAEDAKTFPGASCLPEKNTLAINRDTSGRMFNDSAAAQNWICPIVRDSISLPLEFAAIDVILLP